MIRGWCRLNKTRLKNENLHGAGRIYELANVFEAKPMGKQPVAMRIIPLRNRKLSTLIGKAALGKTCDWGLLCQKTAIRTE